MLLQCPLGYLFLYGSLPGRVSHLKQKSYQKAVSLLELSQFISLNRIISLQLKGFRNITKLIRSDRFAGKSVLKLL